MEKTNKTWEGFETICGYSRAQAIEDGILVDVSTYRETKELGFKFPITLTEAVWAKCVETPENTAGQSIQGRLWDVLWMFRMGIKRNQGDISILNFKLHVQNNESKPAELVELKAICGPGDNGEPVITIMFPDED